MLMAIITLGVMGTLFGALLGFAAVRCHVEGDPIVDQVEAVLPQTQCGQCSFTGCRAYAEAIVAGKADINQCPPGGQSGVLALAELLGRDPKPLDPEHGAVQWPMVAVIDEAQCIGCTLCIQACPVDAIVGAAKQMHTVIAADCTGCKLCVAPCPVDCIRMVSVAETVSIWQWPAPVAP